MADCRRAAAIGTGVSSFGSAVSYRFTYNVDPICVSFPPSNLPSLEGHSIWIAPKAIDQMRRISRITIVKSVGNQP